MWLTFITFYSAIRQVPGFRSHRRKDCNFSANPWQIHFSTNMADISKTKIDAWHDFHLPHSRDGGKFPQPEIYCNFGFRGIYRLANTFSGKYELQHIMRRQKMMSDAIVVYHITIIVNGAPDHLFVHSFCSYTFLLNSFTPKSPKISQEAQLLFLQTKSQYPQNCQEIFLCNKCQNSSRV